jgi:hypothetical protein
MFECHFVHHEAQIPYKLLWVEFEACVYLFSMASNLFLTKQNYFKLTA